jgi:adenine-specific DNA-methyltransferase
MAAKYPYYLLADSPEGIKKEEEIEPQISQINADLKTSSNLRKSAQSAAHDIRKGFVYKRVPHVTLKSIANNPDIKEGMTREQIDAAIARHAETETLYDQPYEDNKTVRVTGPFTVESLSPHRTISVEEKKRLAEEPSEQGFTTKMIGGGQFATVIVENLIKAGVQNTIKNERLKFDRLEVHPGVWIHAEGEYTERKPQIAQISADLKSSNSSNLRKSAQSVAQTSSDSVVRRVAVCIGPEHGTVGPELVKEAAKEAVQGIGFDLLLVCGFAFDPHVSEEAKRYGKLTVLAVRMNPDLSMGEDLLKKTGAGNLFMVFGEPDVEIRKVSSADYTDSHRLKKEEPQNLRKSAKSAANKLLFSGSADKIVVEIKGVDVYDPTTGAIRSSSTGDIACWFIDTNYNAESFFVRHAYFTSAEEPYERLKRALRAEIDEAAWSELYSTTSRPFDPPEKGKIAVKVINHYGDEVLKVYDVKSQR